MMQLPLRQAYTALCTTMLILLLASEAGAVKPRNGRPKSDVVPICKGYAVEAGHRIHFNKMEKELVCGESEVNAWKHIPPAQARFHISTFLQNRGYFFPTFERRDEITIVKPGEKTWVTALTVTGNPPPSFKIWKRRGVIRTVLTPANLSTQESWAKAWLQERGYPCPTVQATADAKTGELSLYFEPGEKLNVCSITEEPVPGINTGILRRYDAFRIGQPFNQNWLTLTSRRTEDDGLVTSAYFLHECTPEGAALTQRTIPGRPRLFVIGFGASTEELAIIKSSWKHARIGRMGSSLKLSAYASLRRQRAAVEAKLYLLPKPSRWYLGPLVSVERQDESQYELLKTNVLIAPAVSWDSQSVGYSFVVGPDVNYTHTYRGDNIGGTHFLTGTIGFQAKSHDFEYYDDTPRSGFSVSLGAEFNHRSLLSSATAQRFSVVGHWLWNIAGFDPPFLVFAVRSGASTTLVDRDSVSFTKLPPQYQHYLGGATTVRGYSRKELPKDPNVALTAAFIGAEIRLVKVLPMNLQPLLLADVGVLGNRSFDWDKPLYWSPGFGMRWGSPFGVFRATAARGFTVWDDNPARNVQGHWQFFFSFGEEF